MDQERRRFIRVAARLLTFVRTRDTGKTVRVLTKDIGGGGICFVSEERFDTDEIVEVEMTLPDRGQPIAFLAAVAWRRPVAEAGKSPRRTSWEIGVKFLSIGPKEQALMVQYAALNAGPPESR